MKDGTYIRFIEGPSKPKTRTWWVVTKDDDIHLGWIGWFARWRKYGFYPKSETVYEQICLREIADFCERETAEHKKAKEAITHG
jgi:hypothetical protein